MPFKIVGLQGKAITWGWHTTQNAKVKVLAIGSYLKGEMITPENIVGKIERLPSGEWQCEGQIEHRIVYLGLEPSDVYARRKVEEVLRSEKII